mmetsp:Transcript_29668/g.40762  ORF Transcript_29668/g.40762 Transcript_29668/m.40762 type:complete len:300 (+) Transcript_29668:1102-2001(+)
MGATQQVLSPFSGTPGRLHGCERCELSVVGGPGQPQVPAGLLQTHRDAIHLLALAVLLLQVELLVHRGLLLLSSLSRGGRRGGPQGQGRSHSRLQAPAEARQQVGQHAQQQQAAQHGPRHYRHRREEEEEQRRPPAGRRRSQQVQQQQAQRRGQASEAHRQQPLRRHLQAPPPLLLELLSPERGGQLGADVSVGQGQQKAGRGKVGSSPGRPAGRVQVLHGPGGVPQQAVAAHQHQATARMQVSDAQSERPRHGPAHQARQQQQGQRLHQAEPAQRRRTQTGRPQRHAARRHRGPQREG